jgi:hypothetical protein
VTGDVPVALFAHRRPDVLTETLACLRAAGIGKLYVFSDGARGPSDEEGVERVREVIRAIDWTETQIVEREENRGLSTSIRSGLDLVFESHEAAVAIEDDIQVAPEFYRYACAGLEHYARSPRIAGVTGLRLPFATAVLDDYPYDVFLSPRFSSWGWATWRDRWRAFDFDAGSLRGRIAASGARLSRAGADVPRMIDEAVVEETLGGAWDVFCAANMLVAGQSFITPVWNMVRYAGYGEGTHHTGDPGWDLRWEDEWRPAQVSEIRFCPEEIDEHLLAAYLRFLDPPGIRASARRFLRTRGLTGAARST